MRRPLFSWRTAVPEVRVLRPFNNGTHHTFVRPGDVLTVSEDRAIDLIRNGLVEPFGSVKAAPVPANKASPMPENKADVTAAVKRGPGRPPRAK